MKVSAAVPREVAEAPENNIEEMQATELAFTTKNTYILHATTFVRWLGDDFSPGQGRDYSRERWG